MKRINIKNRSLCVQPVFIIGSRDENGKVNFAPITWVSVTYDTDRYLLVVSMFGSKRTKENIAKTGQFSANLVSTDMLELLDYFGSRSGADGEKNTLTIGYGMGQVLPVPTLDLSRFIYECQIIKTAVTSDSTTYFGEIVNVQVDETVDISGGIDLTRFDPVIYSGHYHSIGEHLGVIGDFYKK